MTSRARRLTLTTVAVGIAVLVVAGVVGKDWAVEEYYLWRFERAEGGEKWELAEKLGRLDQGRAIVEEWYLLHLHDSSTSRVAAKGLKRIGSNLGDMINRYFRFKPGVSTRHDRSSGVIAQKQREIESQTVLLRSTGEADEYQAPQLVSDGMGSSRLIWPDRAVASQASMKKMRELKEYLREHVTEDGALTFDPHTGTFIVKDHRCCLQEIEKRFRALSFTAEDYAALLSLQEYRAVVH